MHLTSLLLPLVLASAPATEAAMEDSRLQRHYSRQRQHRQPSAPIPIARRASGDSKFLNSGSEKFVVNGTAIPDVNFDIGESYAGQLPIGGDSDGKLYFWFFPSTSADADKEILLWLNGGPGCSSLDGLLKEHGPFIWGTGTYAPVQNPWSWHHITNIVYVEQPVGTGFSQGTVTATNEDEVAQQFMGFWKNFIDTFSMQGYKVYIAGESYAGMYCPYIADNMLEANNTEYFDVKGMLIYDPLIQDNVIEEAPTRYFVDYWANVFPLNDTTRAKISNRSESCGYDAFMDKYLTFPPPGPQPVPSKLPGVDPTSGRIRDDCDVSDIVYDAITTANPGFNIYQVAQLLPVPDDVLGFPYSDFYTAPGRQIYFNRTDVKAAINAPQEVNWQICTDKHVFGGKGRDLSEPSSHYAIPRVIDRTGNVQIAHGSMDFVLMANSSLLAIQNMTWGGKQGFQSLPRSPLFVPHHDNPTPGSASGQGVLGTWHEERGLTWAMIELTGHMVPTWQAALAFRQIEVLLGRVEALNSTTPFPMYANASQPDARDFGFGTGAPVQWNGVAGPGSGGSSCGGQGNSTTGTPPPTVSSSSASLGRGIAGGLPLLVAVAWMLFV